MLYDPNDPKFSRRGFLEVSSGALAAAGTNSVAKFLGPEPTAAAQDDDRSTSDPGPVNATLETQNPSAVSPPPTDAGSSDGTSGSGSGSRKMWR